VIHRALVLISLACCALVVASFAWFARDQVAGASAHQQNEIASIGPHAKPVSAPVTNDRAQPRRFIDNAAKALTSPFSSIVQSDSQWVLHGVPTLLALLAYGVGLGYLARYSRGLASRPRSATGATYP
jgi:hypothetical protein